MYFVNYPYDLFNVITVLIESVISMFKIWLIAIDRKHDWTLNYWIIILSNLILHILHI